MVKTIGYEADPVGGGNEAIEHYKAHKPELVLLDWKMPNMDGVTCAKKILEVDPDARIVMITGYQETSENSMNAGLKKMLKDVVLKPCDLRKLDKIISKTLSS